MTKDTTSSAFTAGPWRTHWLGDDRAWILDDQSNYLAEIVTKDDEGFAVSPDQQKANARLIAAAPEQHEALTNMVDAIVEMLDDESMQFSLEQSDLLMQVVSMGNKALYASVPNA